MRPTPSVAPAAASSAVNVNVARYQATPSRPFQPVFSHSEGTVIGTQSRVSRSRCSQPVSSAGQEVQRARWACVCCRARVSASRSRSACVRNAEASTPCEGASIQASIRLPPQVLSMMPIGTPVTLRSSRAKKWATAENFGAACGEDATHSPPSSCACGSPDHDFGILKWRICGSVARAASASGFADCAMGHSMFDCPLASHTSPTSTSRSTRGCLPSSMRITCGPPAVCAGNASDQRPSAPVCAVASRPAKLTCTRAPGAASPQTRTGWSRCTTMPSAKMRGSSTACAAGIANRTSTRVAARFISDLRTRCHALRCRSRRGHAGGDRLSHGG